MRKGTYEGIEPKSRGALMKMGRRAGLYGRHPTREHIVSHRSRLEDS